MEFTKVKYQDLSARQKENYNFHKIAAFLAEYGYNSIRLTDDYKGADFLAVHTEGDTILKIQLKGRFTIDKKYLNKSIWVAFIEQGKIYLYDHDKLVKKLKENITQSTSWSDNGSYSWNKTPEYYKQYMIKF